MIKVHLNDSKYRYDVFQIINLYYTLEDIVFTESKSEPADFSIAIAENKITLIGSNSSNEYIFRNGIKLSDEIKLGVFIFLRSLTNIIFPWGTMLGIRPSKIALKLLKEGYSDEQIMTYYKEHYYTTFEKSKLCINIAKLEENYINSEPKKVSLYIGMPFCPTRCVYCSFASNPINSCNSLVEPYLLALTKELLHISKYILEKNLQVECVYFGGGTPTSVNEIQFDGIMKKIYEEIITKHNVLEFTVECGRPDSITLEKLQTMKKYKVHRISINPQTMNDKTLKKIGRAHSSLDVIDKFNMARSLSFDNINMDIIVGLEGEGIVEIENTLKEIKKLNPESITIHGLAVKRASKIREKLFTGKEMRKLDQSEIIKMYDKTAELASDLHMKPYYMYRQKNMLGNMENIGYSKSGSEGIYNIQMIEEKQSIIALGADAASKIVFIEEDRIERFVNVKDVKEYIERIDEMINKKTVLLNSLYAGVE